MTWSRSGARVTIAFDDHTTGSFGPIRPVAIRAVLDELAAAGVARAQVRLVCANALHRMCRPAELTRLLDAALVAEFGPRLTCHDAEDPEQIADLGVTAEHGYPVEVSRLVTDSDLTVYVNTNYIRGFTGGWKSVCIGLSTWRSIRVTHDPDGMSMSLDRNRMHAVLDEMGHHLEQRLGRRIFKIDTLLADPFHAAQVFAGGVDETRRAALEVQMRRVPGPAGGGARAGRHPRLRRAGLEPLRDLGPGQSDPDPHLDGARLSGRHDRGGGQAGLHRDHGGGGARRVGPRAPPLVPGGVGARAAARRGTPTRSTPASRTEFARHAAHIDAYRHRFAFHPIHGILATHPLKRLRHVGRVIVAGPRDAHVPRHLGWDVAASVEEAVARARALHGPGATIGVVEQPPMPADPDRIAR